MLASALAQFVSHLGNSSTYIMWSSICWGIDWHQLLNLISSDSDEACSLNLERRGSIHVIAIFQAVYPQTSPIFSEPNVGHGGKSHKLWAQPIHPSVDNPQANRVHLIMESETTHLRKGVNTTFLLCLLGFDTHIKTQSKKQCSGNLQH